MLINLILSSDARKAVRSFHIYKNSFCHLCGDRLFPKEKVLLAFVFGWRWDPMLRGQSLFGGFVYSKDNKPNPSAWRCDGADTTVNDKDHEKGDDLLVTSKPRLYPPYPDINSFLTASGWGFLESSLSPTDRSGGGPGRYRRFPNVRAEGLVCWPIYEYFRPQVGWVRSLYLTVPSAICPGSEEIILVITRYQEATPPHRGVLLIRRHLQSDGYAHPPAIETAHFLCERTTGGRLQHEEFILDAEQKAHEAATHDYYPFQPAAKIEPRGIPFYPQMRKDTLYE